MARTWVLAWLLMVCAGLGGRAAQLALADPPNDLPYTADQLVEQARKLSESTPDARDFQLRAGLALVESLRSRQNKSAVVFDELIAESAKSPDPGSRCSARIVIAEFLTAAGESKKSRALLDLVKTELAGLPPGDVGRFLYITLLCEAYVRVDDARSALDVARLSGQKGALELINLRVAGKAAVHPGNEPVRQELIERIRAVHCEAYGESKRILAFAAVNQVDEARAECDRYPWNPEHGDERNQCLTEIGKAYVRLGRTEDARILAETVVASKASGSDGASLLFALCGDLKRAEDIVEQLPEIDRPAALMRVAYIAYLNGDINLRDRLMDRAESSPKPNTPQVVLAQSILLHVGLGRSDKCLEKLTQITAPIGAKLRLAVAVEMLRESRKFVNPFYPGDRLLDSW